MSNKPDYVVHNRAHLAVFNTNMKTATLFVLGILLSFNGYAVPPKVPLSSHMVNVPWSSHMMSGETLTSADGIVLEDTDKLVSPDSFRPPVEITIVAKTDSTNLRLGYAADQVIFNWELDQNQLRVDGGPADGRHVKGAGHIPKDKYVTIKWLVTPEHQAIYVDDRLRFENCGNYSEIDSPVSVFPANGSAVTVKSIAVKQQ